MTAASEIRGDLVALRRATEGDIDVLAEWFSDPGFVQWWGGVPKGRDEVARKYAGRRRDVQSFIIQEATRPIGYIQAWRKADDAGIDIVLQPESQGGGRGTDAVRALATYLTEDLHWPRVTVDPLLTNKRAIRAFSKAGFVAEREWPDHPDGPSLLMVFRPDYGTMPRTKE